MLFQLTSPALRARPAASTLCSPTPLRPPIKPSHGAPEFTSVELEALQLTLLQSSGADLFSPRLTPSQVCGLLVYVPLEGTLGFTKFATKTARLIDLPMSFTGTTYFDRLSLEGARTALNPLTYSLLKWCPCCAGCHCQLGIDCKGAEFTSHRPLLYWGEGVIISSYSQQTKLQSSAPRQPRVIAKEASRNKHENKVMGCANLGITEAGPPQARVALTMEECWIFGKPKETNPVFYPWCFPRFGQGGRELNMFQPHLLTMAFPLAKLSGLFLSVRLVAGRDSWPGKRMERQLG